ncbi:unnamed protein product [Calypogeia fissa]
MVVLWSSDKAIRTSHVHSGVSLSVGIIILHFFHISLIETSGSASSEASNSSPHTASRPRVLLNGGSILSDVRVVIA